MKKRYIAASVIAVLGLTLFFSARFFDGFSDWYAATVYPFIARAVSTVTGVFPFSLAEFLIAAFITVILFGIVLIIIKAVRNRGYRLLTVFHIFSYYAVLLASVFFVLTASCLVNYNRLPFSAYSGLEITQYSKEELRALADEIVANINAAAAEIELDENMLCAEDGNMTLAAADAMNQLGAEYDVLKAYYPSAKPFIFSELLSGFDTCGFFFPFTIEANYNKDMPVSQQGFSVCHELSHLSGFMQEDEANFIAFLACRSSMNPNLKYSGYFNALIYVLNAYNRSASPEEYAELYSEICGQVQGELINRSAYWKRFEGTVTAAAAQTINDAYLKSNNQTDGIKSYGRVVDLLIADYLERHAEG